MSKYIKFLGGGDCGGFVIVREIPVAFGEVDRRVLVAGIDAELGLITCVWSRNGQLARQSTLWSRGTGGTSGSSGVDEAEGRDRGKRLTGTPNRDMTQR